MIHASMFECENLVFLVRMFGLRLYQNLDLVMYKNN